MTKKWTYPTDRTPTDKELAAVLPTLSLEERIETIIRKYIGGCLSYYDGETPGPVAEVRMTGHMMRKLRPWLSLPGDTKQALQADPVERTKDTSVPVTTPNLTSQTRRGDPEKG